MREQSITPARRRKAHRTKTQWKEGRPPRPYPDFPLSPHATGTWCKKIKGKLYHFGRWARRVNGKLERVPGDGWEEALKLYKYQAEAIVTGRPKPLPSDQLTVADLCNRFHTAKRRKFDATEMTARAFGDYCRTTDLIVEHFGAKGLVVDLTPADFERLRAIMAKRWGPVRLGNEIGRVRSVFKYAFDYRLITHPVHFGNEFVKPKMAVLRKHKRNSGKTRVLEAHELRQVIAAAGQPLRAMILLGLNCGYGNHDIASLPLAVVDLKRGWIDFPRPKTEIERRCPLWPETVAALREAIESRRTPRKEADADLVFISPTGGRYIRPSRSEDPTKWGNRTDLVGAAFSKLLTDLDLKRKGFGFYSLRHVFETVAGASKDQVAVDLIMGHADHSMAANYRQWVEDERLVAVVQHVHGWLFDTKAGKK